MDRCTNKKPTHGFPTPVYTKLCSTCHRFTVTSMPIYGPHIHFVTPFGGVRVGLLYGVENCTNQNVDPTFLFDFYTRWATIHNPVDRQADIATGIGELCSSVAAACHLTSIHLTSMFVLINLKSGKLCIYGVLLHYVYRK